MYSSPFHKPNFKEKRTANKKKPQTFYCLKQKKNWSTWLDNADSQYHKFHPWNPMAIITTEKIIQSGHVIHIDVLLESMKSCLCVWFHYQFICIKIHIFILWIIILIMEFNFFSDFLNGLNIWWSIDRDRRHDDKHTYIWNYNWKIYFYFYSLFSFSLSLFLLSHSITNNNRSIDFFYFFFWMLIKALGNRRKKFYAMFVYNVSVEIFFFAKFI